ncbi:MAG: hypothetical protein ACLR9X_01320 [Clostridia bacterium]|nr:hypothetical protein [Clostridium sp.]
MVTTEYKIAYSQVLEILKHISVDDYNKIPQNMVQMFKNNASDENYFVYNSNKTLKEQNVSEIARTIIAILFRDYWATNEQKEKILSVQNKEREKNKKEQYNTNNLFANKERTNEQNIDIVKEKSMVVVNEEKWYKKIFSWIKSLFNRNK